MDAEAAARASLLKMTPRKRRLIRLFECLLFPVVRLAEAARLRREFSGESVRSILVIEYWNIGDVVNLLPFLENLRAAYPEARISLLANPSMRAVLGDQSLVDEIIPFTTPWSAHFRRWQKYNPLSLGWLELARAILSLRRRKFDLALTGRMDIRDNFLAWLVGAKRRVGYGFAGGRLFLTDAVVPDPSQPHRSQVWLQLLRHLGIAMRTEVPRLRLSSAEEACAAAFLRAHRVGDSELVVGVHPGARVATRRWGTQNFAAVAARLESEFKARILWFADPEEEETPQCISAAWTCVALPLRQFLAVLARCCLLVCNDSGPMHLATALGVPVVTVFGPQEPAWFGPIGARDRVVIRPGFWCRPCDDYCIFDQPYCLRTISSDQVYRAVRAALLAAPMAPRPLVGNTVKACLANR